MEKKNFQPGMAKEMLLAVESNNGTIAMVNVEDYLGKQCREYIKCFGDCKKRKQNKMYLLGCTINTKEFRRDVLGPMLNKAAGTEGFSLVTKGGYMKDHESTTYCCSGGGYCPFSFSIYWDNKHNNWYIWPSGTGNANHSGHRPHVNKERVWKPTLLIGHLGQQPQLLLSNTTVGTSYGHQATMGAGIGFLKNKPSLLPSLEDGVVTNLLEGPNRFLGPQQLQLPLGGVDFCLQEFSEKKAVGLDKNWKNFRRRELYQTTWVGKQKRKRQWIKRHLLVKKQQRTMNADIVAMKETRKQEITMVKKLHEKRGRNPTRNCVKQKLGSKSTMEIKVGTRLGINIPLGIKCAAVRMFNEDFWKTITKEDRKPSNIDEAMEWILFLFTPKHELRAKRDQVLLHHSGSREHFLQSTIFAVARNTVQVVGMRALHVTLHGAAGPKGYQNLLVQDFRIHRMERWNNQLFDCSDRLCPVVLNSGILVQWVSKIIKEKLPKFFPDLMMHAKMDKKRNFVAIHTALTTQEATQWWTLQLGAKVTVRMPGHLSVMDKLDEKLLQFIGRTSNSLLTGFEKEAFRDCNRRVPFFPKTKQRELLQLYLTKKFCLPDKDRVRAEGVSIVISNGATRLHYDTKNDVREGHEWVVTASATFDMTTENTWADMDKTKLVDCGIDLHAVTVMFILYTRHIVGVKGEQVQKLQSLI